MLHARRPVDPVTAAQNCAIDSPVSVVTSGGGVRPGTLSGSSSGGRRRRVEPSRSGPSVRHRPSDGEQDAERFVAAGESPDGAVAKVQAGRVYRHHRRDPRRNITAVFMGRRTEAMRDTPPEGNDLTLQDSQAW